MAFGGGGDDHLVPVPRGTSRISSPASLDQTVVKLWWPPTPSPVHVFKK